MMKSGNYILAILLLGLTSCQSKQRSPEQFVQSLPQVYPKKVSQFRKVDSLYFGHLGYQTIPMADGSVVIPLRKGQRLLQVTPEGKLIKEVAAPGRGPGELKDPLFIQQTSNGGVLVVDQGNQKIIQFNSDLELVTELKPKPLESATVTGIYPIKGRGQYVIRASSNKFLFDKEASPSMILSSYSLDDGYGKQLTLRTRPMALLMIDGQLAGGRKVPFASSQQIASDPGTESLYSYWTGSSKIAELSTNLDTLNTIRVNLPAQKLSDAEYDSIEADTRDQQWKTLKDRLPEVKVPVGRMLVDRRGRFWLKLNYRGYTQKWLIMTRDGKFQKIVHLPTGSMLTHISDKNLGVRLDDITFALFEPVK